MKPNQNNEPYFAEREEKAVLDYINSTSSEEKNKIYNKILIEPFQKMIQSILRRYPIHIGNYGMSEVEENALTHMIENMIKYKPYIIECYNGEKWVKLKQYGFMNVDDAEEKLKSLLIENTDNDYRIFNSKAFSYCQTIIRNYYIDHGKKSYSDKKINISFDDHVDEINENAEYQYVMEIDKQKQLEDLIDIVVTKIEDKIDNDTTMKKNEIIVGDAIINVLKNWHVLFLEDTPEGKYDKRVTNKYAKSKVLLFIKEQTGLSAKEIRTAIKPFKEIYFIEKIGYWED